MVKLSESKGTGGESAVRIFGNERMGVLFSQFQSVVIRSGIELETTIQAKIPPEILTTLKALNDPDREMLDLPPIQVVPNPIVPILMTREKQ